MTSNALMSTNTQVATGGQRVLDMYHQCQERSDFYSMVDLSKVDMFISRLYQNYNMTMH